MKTMQRIPFILIIAMLVTAGCQPKDKIPVVVFAAGSVIMPMGAIEQAFEAENPDIDLQMEYHGSIQVIRHVTELKEPIDIVITADHALIPQLMYTVKVDATDEPYADWYIRFASNHLALAYTDTSQYQQEIDTDNWFEVLSRPDVRVGIADPRFDAAGYPAYMVFK